MFARKAIAQDEIGEGCVAIYKESGRLDASRNIGHGQSCQGWRCTPPNVAGSATLQSRHVGLTRRPGAGAGAGCDGGGGCLRC